MEDLCLAKEQVLKSADFIFHWLKQWLSFKTGGYSIPGSGLDIRSVLELTFSWTFRSM